MKSKLITFLQIIIILIAVFSIFILLYEPHIEGRNINSTLFEIYFKDPFLAYVYASSILFYTILYQEFKLLEFLKNKKTISIYYIKALNIIKNCSLSLICLIFFVEIYLIIFQRNKDDIAGGVFIGVLLILIFLITFILAFKVNNYLKNKINKN